MENSQSTKFKQLICPHCGKIGGANTMKTWHFDRCKDGPNLRPPRRPKAVKGYKPPKEVKTTVKWYVILPDRSVHPTAYSLLYNAEFALENLNMIKAEIKVNSRLGIGGHKPGVPATGLRAKGMPATGGAPKGLVHPKSACIHCNKLVSSSMMLKWHAEKCINKPINKEN